MSVELKDGSWYVTRDGDVVMVKESFPGTEFPFEVADGNKAYSSMRYTKNGKYVIEDNTPCSNYNLVREATEAEILAHKPLSLAECMSARKDIVLAQEGTHIGFNKIFPWSKDFDV